MQHFCKFAISLKVMNVSVELTLKGEEKPQFSKKNYNVPNTLALLIHLKFEPLHVDMCVLLYLSGTEPGSTCSLVVLIILLVHSSSTNDP